MNPETAEATGVAAFQLVAPTTRRVSVGIDAGRMIQRNISKEEMKNLPACIRNPASRALALAVVGRKIEIGVTPNATLLHVKNGFAEIGILRKSDIDVMNDPQRPAYFKGILSGMQVRELFKDRSGDDALMAVSRRAGR